MLSIPKQEERIQWLHDVYSHGLQRCQGWRNITHTLVVWRTQIWLSWEESEYLESVETFLRALHSWMASALCHSITLKSATLYLLQWWTQSKDRVRFLPLAKHPPALVPNWIRCSQGVPLVSTSITFLLSTPVTAWQCKPSIPAASLVLFVPTSYSAP